MDTTIYSELGKQAIAGASAAGADVRDEAEFDLLQDEIAKLSNPGASGTPDWNRVVQLSTTLLADKGKDVLVACYLAGGLLQTRGLPGLADGLRVLSDLFEQYWESLFPPLQRMRGRRNALQWLADWIQRHAGEVDWSAMPPQEPELVASLRQRLEAIDAVLRDRDEDAPSLRPLINLVNTLPLQEPAPEQASPPVPEQGQPSAPQAPPVPQLQSGPASRALPASQLTPGALEAAADVDAALEQVCVRLGDLSAWWLNADFSSPLAFRLGRLAAWAAIDAAPPAEGGRTRIAPPISQMMDALARLLENQADEDLVRFAEAQLPAFPFWLDLNRISAQALGRMGERFAAAQREVCGETARLMTRLPGLEGLAFANGTPFADGETLAWLATLAAPAGDAAAVRRPASRTRWRLRCAMRGRWRPTAIWRPPPPACSACWRKRLRRARSCYCASACASCCLPNGPAPT